MTDEQIFAAFPAALGDRIDPDPGFGDGLYESLAEDLGFRASVGSRMTLLDRLARAIGLRRPFTTSPSFRVARVVSIVALVVILLLALVVAAGHLLQSRPALTGDEIVQRSQALYSNPPAFDMTVGFASPRVVRFRYDGDDHLRSDVISGSFFLSPEGPGSFRIDTSTQTATYDASKKSWLAANAPAGLPPLASMFPLNWLVQAPYQPPATPPGYDCPNGWQHTADGTVADRPAYHVTCGSETDVWIDQASFLVVGSGSHIAATSLAIGAAVDPALFDLTMPRGAYDANNPPPSTVLVAGQPGPDWTGSLQGGGDFDSRSLRGAPAAIYFWAEWCEPCLHESLDSFANAARSGHAGIGFVSVASATGNEAALQAAIAASGAGYLVVRDDGSGPILGAWGITAVPALVLLRPDGTVASVTVGALTSADLDAALAALAAGEPIPSPAATDAPCTCSPAPSPTAGGTP
jgi:thiol-disulfide isomerase/thioredoxin